MCFPDFNYTGVLLIQREAAGYRLDESSRSLIRFLPLAEGAAEGEGGGDETETIRWTEKAEERFRGTQDFVREKERGQSAVRQVYYSPYIEQVFLESNE